MKLIENTMLITGGSSGIGFALAKRFVELGNTVLVTGRDPERLQAARRQIPALRTIRCDVADPKAVGMLAEAIAEEAPALNVLVNNAGIMRCPDLSQAAADLKDFTDELDTNLAGPIRTVSVLIDRLRRNQGTIINVSSALAFVPLPAAPIYSATKAALHSYSLSLRQELREYGVEVVEIMPPAVTTNLGQRNLDFRLRQMTAEDLVETVLRGLRSGRQELRPGMANLLYWLSRIAPAFIARQLAKRSARTRRRPR